MIDMERVCQLLKPEIGEQAEQLWRAHNLSTDSKMRKLIEVRAQYLYQQHLQNTVDDKRILLPNPPPKEVAKGEYYLGDVVYNDRHLWPLGLKDQDLLRHISLAGISGAGKSNLVMVLLLNFLQKQKKFMAFDFKSTYRDILQLVPEEQKKELYIFTLSGNASILKFNPLIPPPRTDPKVWIKWLSNVIAHSFLGGHGVVYLLQKGIDHLYKEFGVYDGTINNSKRWPVMHDLVYYLENQSMKGRASQWLQSTLRGLGRLCFGPSGDVLNTSSNEGLDELMNKYCILELGDLASDEKDFYCESLLLWIYEYRSKLSRREEFDYAIYIDEAHNVLRKSESGEESVVEMIFRQIREFGVALLFADQMPSKISEVAYTNTATTISFNLKHNSNIHAISKTMSFEDESNEKKYLGRLPIGSCLCRLQNRWPHPFYLKIPKVRINKGEITDEHLQQHMQSVSAQRATEYPQESRIQLNKGLLDAHNNKKEIIEFLMDTINNPKSGIVERYKRLELTAYKGNEIQSTLLSMKYIKAATIITGNGWKKVLQVVKKGVSYLRQHGEDCTLSREGIEHLYWKHTIADYFLDKGYDVEVEAKRENGGHVDVLVKNGDVKIPVEIITGKSSDILSNIIKNIENQDNRKIILVGTNTEAISITKRIKHDNNITDPRIGIIPAQEFETVEAVSPLERLNSIVKNKTVTIGADVDCDSMCAAALMYQIINGSARKINLITKASPITSDDVPPDSDITLVTNIEPIDAHELNLSNVNYIDSTESWLPQETKTKTDSFSELIFSTLIPDTDNPYHSFLALAGSLAQNPRLPKENSIVVAKAKQLIPSLLNKENSIQKYVSQLNIGKKMLRNGDFILKMLCEATTFDEFIRHPDQERISELQRDLKKLTEMDLDSKSGKHVDYAIINEKAQIEGLLAARNARHRPLLVINTYNGTATGSLRVPKHCVFEAGEFLKKLQGKVSGLVAGGQNRSGGFSIEAQKLDKVIALL